MPLNRNKILSKLRGCALNIIFGNFADANAGKPPAVLLKLHFCRR